MRPTFPHRRSILLGAPLALVAACSKAAPPDAQLTVFKDPNCGCCGGWVAHMKRAGFSAKVVETSDLAAVRVKYGVSDSLASCHTALISNYVVEGHVPADDVRRLLREKPSAAGIAVPGMPLGSPGMETPDGRREPYQVMLFGSGLASVYATHS